MYGKVAIVMAAFHQFQLVRITVARRILDSKFSVFRRRKELLGLNENDMRRLPVYILIDISSSMRGEPIEAVKAGIDALLKSLCNDPYTLETVYLSIITYNSQAEQLFPLTEVYKLHAPELVAIDPDYSRSMDL